MSDNNEALVEQLAEAIADALNEEMAKDDPLFDHTIPTKAGDWADVANALAPLVAAQVEAAVSVARAERDKARDWATGLDAELKESHAARVAAEADLRAGEAGAWLHADDDTVCREPQTGLRCVEHGRQIRWGAAPYYRSSPASSPSGWLDAAAQEWADRTGNPIGAYVYEAHRPAPVVTPSTEDGAS